MRTSDRNTATSFRKAPISAPIGPVSIGHRDPFRLIWTALRHASPELTTTLELYPCVQLQRLASATSIDLAEVRITDGVI